MRGVVGQARGRRVWLVDGVDRDNAGSLFTGDLIPSGAVQLVDRNVVSAEIRLIDDGGSQDHRARNRFGPEMAMAIIVAMQPCPKPL